MSMLIGYEVRKIDSKGRIAIPANMRSYLGDEFIASRGIGKCLALYSLEGWEEFMQSFSNVPQKKRKRLEFFFSANAKQMSLDGQGRLLLNTALREKVDLADAPEAVVFGNHDKIEIWNADLFFEELESVESDEVVDIFDESGI